MAWGEILSSERRSSGWGLRLHLASAKPVVVTVRPRACRAVEGKLRSAGVTIVDEYGAQIDQSQFDKEADPSFNHKVGPGFWYLVGALLTPNWYLGWRHRRLMRQSSDDA